MGKRYWERQEKAIEVKFVELNRSYYSLKKRYLSALARLEALAKVPADIDSRLLGTAFESLDKILSAGTWSNYTSFYEQSDISPPSFELQTIVSDHFILHEYSDLVTLHLIDCKGLVCHLYI